MATKKKHPGGRPTKYKEEYARQAEVVCEESGFIVTRLARLFNVNQSTITLWMREHEEFSTSVKRGKDVFDVATAEDCLYKRLRGYDTEEEVSVLGEDGEMHVVKKVKKFVPPDTTAQIFFLKNRNPKRWRDKQQVELSGNIEVSWEDGKEG